jgi:hypothetical protein
MKFSKPLKALLMFSFIAPVSHTACQSINPLVHKFDAACVDAFNPSKNCIKQSNLLADGLTVVADDCLPEVIINHPGLTHRLRELMTINKHRGKPLSSKLGLSVEKLEQAKDDILNCSVELNVHRETKLFKKQNPDWAKDLENSESTDYWDPPGIVSRTLSPWRTETQLPVITTSLPLTKTKFSKRSSGKVLPAFRPSAPLPTLKR